MVRFTSCALGLVLFGPAVATSAPGDATVLVQRQARARARVEEEAAEDSLTRHGAPPLVQESYAFERYKVGEMVEGRAKDGRWLPCFVTGRGATGNLWNIHVSDEFPGYDLPNVPTQMLRRPISPGMSDYYVDNSWLNHKGVGVKYRHSKNMHNKSAEYAPWASLVVGRDEGDGWLRVADGFLPMEVNGAPVLIKRERLGKPTPMPLDFARAVEKQHQVLMPKDPTPAPLSYDIGEWVQFRSKKGEWYPAQVSGNTNLANTYHVTVRLDDGYTVYPVTYVHASRLKKTSPEKKPVDPDANPLCQKDGCILVRVRTNSSSELFISVSKKVKTENLQRMACNRLKIGLDECQRRTKLHKNGAELDGKAHIHEAGLEDHDIVDMNVVAETAIDQLLNAKMPIAQTATPQSLDRNDEPSADTIEELLKNIA